MILTRAATTVFALASAALVLVACGDGDDDGFDGDPTVLPDDPDDYPAWLKLKGYREWDGESMAHESMGPHPAQVRVYINDVLAQSLAAGNRHHPVDSVAIKEVIEADGTTLKGWALSRKIKETTDATVDGSAYYWFQKLDGSIDADGPNVELCYGCHNAAFGMDRDHFMSDYPLQ